MPQSNEAASWRRRVHDVLEAGFGSDRVANLVNAGLVLLICLNVAAFAIETVPSIGEPYAAWFQLFDWFSVIVFAVEYGVRVWSCVEQPILSHMPAWRARASYAARPLSIVDLLAFLPALLAPMLPLDLAVLRVLRVFRVLKIARYSTALHSLGRVVVDERGPLLGTLVIITCFVVVAATGMYLIEREAQPKVFGTIPDAMWWAVVTLATIGYGDAVPVTTAGKMLAGLTIVLGLGVFALPIAIIATGFSREVNRREFVVTWSLVAVRPEGANHQ
jgi:voltage-gated potassium channel